MEDPLAAEGPERWSSISKRRAGPADVHQSPLKAFTASAIPWLRFNPNVWS